MNKTDAWWAIAIAATVPLILYPFSVMGVDPYHDGCVLKPALDVAVGGTLFKDTFAYFGPLTIYLQALSLKLFGPSLWSLRLLTIVFYGMFASALYLCSRAFLTRAQALASVWAWLIFGPFYFEEGNWGGFFLSWPSVYAMSFQMVSLALFVWGLKLKRNRLFFWAGISGALVFWCRQPIGMLHGVALAGAFVGWWWVQKLRWQEMSKMVLPFLTGTVALHLTCVLVLASMGTLGAWYEQNMVQAWNWMQAQKFGIADNPVATLNAFARNAKWVVQLCLTIVAFSIFAFFAERRGRKLQIAGWISLSVLFVVLCFNAAVQYQIQSSFMNGLRFGCAFLLPLYFALFFLIEWKKRDSTYLLLLPVCLVAFSAFSQFAPWADEQHVFWAISPAFGLIVFALRKPIFAVGLVAVTAIVAVQSLPRLQGYGCATCPKYVKATQPKIIEGLYISPEQVERWDAVHKVVQTYLKTHPNGAALNVANDPLWGATISKAVNPGGYWFYWPYFPVTLTQSHQWESFVSEKKPLVFLQEIAPQQLRDLLVSKGYRRVMLQPNLEIYSPAIF